MQRDGQRRSFYSSAPGRKEQREANSKADQWLEDGIETTTLRVEAVYPQWLETVRLTTSLPNYNKAESQWRIWIQPMIGKKRLVALNDQDLQDIVNKMYSQGRSRKTLQNLASNLRAFCKYCRKRKLTSYVPEDLTIPSGARLVGKKILQPDELAVLFRESTTMWRGKEVEDAYINAYRFQVLTGLRPGELIGLRWGDIHGNILYIQRSVNTLGQETRGKNHNAVRSFVLTQMAQQVLEEQRKLTGKEDSVFGIPKESNYYSRWKAYCKTHNLTPISLYELRHTFVSVIKTLPAGTVKPLVGHSQDMDTFGVYAHALAGEGERTANAINDIFQKLLGNE